MPDTASDPSTSRTIEVDGATLSDTLDFNGDHDWFAVTLVAGQTYTFITSSSSGTNDTSTDTTLAVRDPSGTLLAFNDDYDNPPGQFSQITFTATVSGIYYLDVGGYNDADTGAYQISATTALPTDLPVFTNDEIALQLTDGYWDGDDHHFDVVAGGSLTVNLDSLTTQGLFLARAALELWSDVIGITFVELPAGETVDIEFTDDEAGAFTSMSWSNGIMDFAQVNVSTQWLQSYGSGLNSYSMQTYVHEIGHALGLGHGGNYNGTASYPSDALYANDAWPATIMSYFDQRYDNSWFSAQGFTYQYVLSPMVADIVAATNLYGPRGALTRTGDTTYGFNNTSGRDIYDPAVVSGATVAIIDDGGVDTLDYSLTGNSQQIYLEPELFSNVLGRTGNLVIARGTVIENAIGGSGSDIIIGNGANNVLTGNGGMDILYGKDGNDTLDGGAGDDEIDGGAGADTIIASAGNDRYRGGSGTDTFVFGPALASLDAPVITDFEAGDLIDLNGSTVTIASFIGTADFSGTAGEYRFYWLGDQTIVEYDGNGDGAPDGSLTIGNGAFTLVQVTTPAGAHNLQIEGSGPVNSAPTLDNPLADRSSDEDTALSFAIPADAFGDADGDTLAYSARLASGGALPAWLAFDAATRTFSGTPVQDFNGTIEIEVTASDGTAQASDVFTLTILPVNDAPVAVDDSVSANQDTVAVFTIASLLGNDSDVDGDQLALSLPGSTTAQGGTIALTGDTITYTPAPGFFGDDSFTYLVSDGNGGTDTATVTIDVARNTVITGTPGNDRLTGTPLADEINGLGGNDIIDGRGGDDTMRGGAGDDTYYIDSSADLVVELAGEGRDFVIATANFVLGANVEDLRLQNSSPMPRATSWTT
ncbi:tandem-95 repeat protein [Aurantiacibacter sp. MUD11]|uniref:tandem-95 repeat protein n=1 Tax=Aurantiacibacter sp. MUD11 TaxID=3003265 RepID=UPI0022AABA29|nr:tandem-95 repeat protein [Aurantiacibacter sp. MUD11]WAT17997.1 tandem-95 repeat protein [Aurantiacibacter sp. MUD11]